MKPLYAYFILLITISAQAQTNKTGFTDFLTDYLNVKYTEEFDEYLYVGVRRQRLFHIKKDTIFHEYIISTASKGAGNKFGSYKTPVGLHSINAKIGENAPIGAIFKNRKFTGEIAEIYNDTIDREDDVITSRILWLSGQENGVNTGQKSIDSKKRYIYIHGTAEEGLLGRPASHGCVRMNNQDIIDLFDEVREGLKVVIINN